MLVPQEKLCINPRRARAARVTVLGPLVFLSVCLSLTTFSATTRNETTKERYQKVQCYAGFDFRFGDFRKSNAFDSYGVKTSQYN